MKLRLHIDNISDLLDEETKYIGRAFINKTCKFYDTQELRCKADTQKHRKAKKSTTHTGETQEKHSTCAEGSQIEADSMTEAEDTIPKKLNINTYKTHSLGDYGRTICWLRTPGSYSTTIVDQ